MFRLDERLKVYLHRAPVDFRLNINGLAALVQHALGLDPFAPCVYVFSNRRSVSWDVTRGASTSGFILISDGVKFSPCAPGRGATRPVAASHSIVRVDY